MNIMTTLKKMKMKILWGAQGAFGKRKILCENKFLQAIWSVQPWPCRNECFPLEFQCLCKIDKQRVFIQEEKHHYTISMVIPFLIKVLCNGYFCKLNSLLNKGLQNSCGPIMSLFSWFLDNSDLSKVPPKPSKIPICILCYTWHIKAWVEILDILLPPHLSFQSYISLETKVHSTSRFRDRATP